MLTKGYGVVNKDSKVIIVEASSTEAHKYAFCPSKDVQI